MNNMLETLKREWERSILLFLVLILVVVVGYFAYDYLNREEEEASASKSKAALPSYYDTSLLTPGAVPSLPEGVNPMSCVFAKPAPKPVRGPSPRPWSKPSPRPAPKPAAKPAAKPVAKPAVKPVVKPVPPKPKPKPKPKRKRVFEFVYVGNMMISGGGSGAQLSVCEILSKKLRNRFKARLAVGEKLFDGLFEVVEFDKYKVVLRHSGQKRLVIRMGGKKRRITLEVSD